MDTIIGIFVGAILAYFFNLLGMKREKISAIEEQYITGVCIPILKMLERILNDGKQIDLPKTIEQMSEIYNGNLICINQKDQDMLNQLRYCPDKDIHKACSDLQIYFQSAVNNYKGKLSREQSFFGSKYNKLYKGVIVAIKTIGCLCVAIGFAGVFGVYAWNLRLINWDDRSILNIAIGFEDIWEVVRFIVIGLLLVTAAIFFQKKIYNETKNQ